MSSPHVSLSAYYRLVRDNRNFRLLWSAQIVSELGDWFYAVAIYSLLLEYTGNAKSVAVAFVLQVLPQFFVAPTTGMINDRISRKRVMIFADWTRAAIVLGMLLVRGPQMVWFLYVLLFLETIMWALFEPGRNAVVPNITSGHELIVANAISSTTWSLNFAIGSAIGGLVAAFFGRNTVFVVNALSFVASALLIGRMQFSEPHVNPAPLRARDLADFSFTIEGIRYVSRDRRLVATMLVKCGLGFMGANWVLLPILGERTFPVHLPGLDASRAAMLGMSLLLGCRGLGALLGPFVSTNWAGHTPSRLRLGILAGFVTGALGYVALGMAQLPWQAYASVILAHAGGSTIWVFSTTLLQLQTDDRFRGRVFSAEFAFQVVTMSLSSYLAGIFADVGVPVRSLATYVGLAVLVPAIAWGFALRLWRQAR